MKMVGRQGGGLVSLKFAPRLAALACAAAGPVRRGTHLPSLVFLSQAARRGQVVAKG